MATYDVKRFPSRNCAGIDPVLTRKGGVSHRAGYGLTLLACLFTAYVFGYLPWLDFTFDSAVRTTQSKQAAVTTSFVELLPYLMGCLAAFLLIVATLQFRRVVRWFRVSSVLRGRQETPIEVFIVEARAAGVRRKVATEAYRLLQPRYGRTMRIEAGDRLREDLRLSSNAVHDLGGNLLQRCDRIRRPGETLPHAPTVMELMQFVQRSRLAFIEISDGAPRAHTSPAKGAVCVAPLRLPPELLATARKAATCIPLRIK